ncbi:class I SAM-dependent methyltransferase [Rufibacter sediminis]|uniref:Class I SAM-dependent methyltransferase n=1 Tax=Rufibacter sediminis TaxID=2762756 RepID=A0ABR6VZP3_9BACT|nr:class I SAM-dependent methyltransferase [Rufibacter sediminis]MBC3542183.1 class I SAM-dependent methyltransferase [Rufibacter sediminis]
MINKLKHTVRDRIVNAVRPMVEGMVKQRLLPMDSRVLDNSFITGKLLPYNTTSTEYIVKVEKDGRASASTPPIPPLEYWEGYADSDEDYLAGGRKDMAAMLSILNQANETPLTLTKVLDLGCAAGRMLRHYPCLTDTTELWGSDINAKYINWCQQNFEDPFYFLTNTTAPHLPFEDNSFDLVYCGSVFTHITDTADAWLMEIRRILRKGGYAYLTIHDEHTLDLMFTKYKDDPLFFYFVEAVRKFYEEQSAEALKDYVYFTIFSDPASQIFYNREYLVKKWSRFATVVSVTPEAHDHQTAILLRKP